MTLKLAWPLAFVVPPTTLMLEFPLPAVNETALPLTGLLLASLSVTVMVEIVVPSAGTDVGLALTVDVVAETAPGMTVKLLLVPVVPPLPVAVAVIVMLPVLVMVIL